MSTLFIVFTFVFIKRRRSKPPKDEDSFAPNPKSHVERRPQAAFSKPDQGQRVIDTGMNVDEQNNQAPTPRWLPDLNFMLSDSSDDSTATETRGDGVENRVTFVLLPEPAMDVQMRTILSPIDGSVSVVHLLGLGIRSDDEIDEISICSSPARMEGEDGDEGRFWV